MSARLADQLRAAFLKASGHSDGKDAVADKALEILTGAKPNYAAAASVIVRKIVGEKFTIGDASGEDAFLDAVREAVDAAKLPRGWANPPKCVECDQRGVVAEVRCADHAATKGRP
jgi:hypothetical protein